MTYMFSNAFDFDQNLHEWDVSGTAIDFIFRSSKLSTANYDSILVSWSQQDVLPEINFLAENSTYCLGDEARAFLIDSMHWNISDGGNDCSDITTEWTGATSTDWFDSSNWTQGVPTRGSVAFVPTVPNENYPVIDTAGAACARFLSAPGSNLIIKTDTELSAGSN